MQYVKKIKNNIWIMQKNRQIDKQNLYIHEFFVFPWYTSVVSISSQIPPYDNIRNHYAYQDSICTRPVPFFSILHIWCIAISP